VSTRLATAAREKINNLFVFSPFCLGDFDELDDDIWVTRPDQIQNVACELEDILVKRSNIGIETLESLCQSLLRATFSPLGLVHRLVPKVLQLIELITNNKKIRRRTKDILAIRCKHTLNVIELCLHFKKVIDHLLRRLEVPMYHGHL
jgi:hypothetical protein